tara:strand:+ start:114 stop:497 length:384 start_codon:yes stop_codon:yes gene_type:complete
MDIAIEPEIYQPSTDFNGNYIDSVPNFKFRTSGIICPCSNKDKVFCSRSNFVSHSKTKKHLKWLEEINNNKTNYLIDNTSLKETIKNQRIIIANYEKEIRELKKRIEELTPKYEPSVDLLGLNDIDF